MLKRKAEVFAPTDGILWVATPTDRLFERGSDFSEPLWLDPLFSLAFRRMRISTRDVEIAEATGFEITVKVETRNVMALEPDYGVILEDKVFDLTRIEDRGRTCWLWLSEVATDGQVGLVPDSVTRDEHGIPAERHRRPTLVWCRRVSPSTRRILSAGTDDMRPALSLRLRSSDYLGESQLVRNGVRYSVVSTEQHGMWLDLTCNRKVSDR